MQVRLILVCLWAGAWGFSYRVSGVEECVLHECAPGACGDLCCPCKCEDRMGIRGRRGLI